MSDLRLVLFDDARGRHWAPFTLTRPAGELLFGCMTLRERAEQVLGLSCAGYLTRHALAGFDEPEAPPTLDPDADEVTSGERIFLNSRVALEEQELPSLSGPARLVVGGSCVGWVLPDGEPAPEDGWIRNPAAARDPGATVELEGTLLVGPWDLVTHGPARIRADVEHRWLYDHTPDGVVRLGSGELSMDATAEVEPGVVVDTRRGPVRLEEGVRVEGPARLTGPLFVGRDTLVLGGDVGRSSIGPVCKLRGEVTDCVVLGYSNKGHEGHLGHAVLGRWVNLGAGTTNSNLKNNYGSVRVWTPEGELDTGVMKVGCFLGDHVKTGIGTMLNTGTVVGAGSNVFGSVMPPKVVPPFSWGSGADLRDYNLDRFLQVAELAMDRRDQRLTSGMRRILTMAWNGTRSRRAE